MDFFSLSWFAEAAPSLNGKLSLLMEELFFCGEAGLNIFFANQKGCSFLNVFMI